MLFVCEKLEMLQYVGSGNHAHSKKCAKVDEILFRTEKV